ncbi:MAG: aldehyde dehydrogenase family protein [Desulfocapsaceae bacterium]|nr:aldehyde dehydrogenase family protein [Desulfocapsaceae bacterium]
MEFLKDLGLKKIMPGISTGTDWITHKNGNTSTICSPVDGQVIAHVQKAAAEDYDHIIQTAQKAFSLWRSLPAPQRGNIIRIIGDGFRSHKGKLGSLVTYETGKPIQEGLGEVQELIDICDFSAGQSRMLYGMTTVSERPSHRLFEQYHPLGIIGIITAFNFPLAVWGWNAMIGAVCGDVSIWKPSSRTPVSAIAAQKIVAKVLQQNNLPEGIFSLLIGDRDLIGERLLNDRRVPLISFTGSVAAGRHAATTVAARLGRSILELGGNNAIIITEHADLSLAIPAVVFGAVGTAGQRCTTTRRLIIHDSLFATVKKQLVRAYKSIQIGNPLSATSHMGPLIDRNAVQSYLLALAAIENQGGTLVFGGKVLEGAPYDASCCYVQPTLAEVQNHFPIVQEETFAPILYLIRYKGDVNQALALQNQVRQGLSSAIFTTDYRQAEIFLSAAGSDCGIANINIGTSGAEIGGAFGGEKETGGGRESGSDAWKAYMRRQTVTGNYGSSLPLAQGIRFDIS